MNKNRNEFCADIFVQFCIQIFKKAKSACIKGIILKWSAYHKHIGKRERERITTHHWYQQLLCSRKERKLTIYGWNCEHRMQSPLISARVQNGWSYLILCKWNSNEGAVLLCNKPFTATGFQLFFFFFYNLVPGARDWKQLVGIWTDRVLRRLWARPPSEWIQRGSWWSDGDALNRLPSSPGARSPSAGCWEIELAHVLAITSQHGIEPSISARPKQAHIKPALCLLFLLTHIMTLFKYWADTNLDIRRAGFYPAFDKNGCSIRQNKEIPLSLFFFTVSVTEYVAKEANDSLIGFHTPLRHALPFTSFQTQQDTSAPSEGGQQRGKGHYTEREHYQY